MIDRVSKYLGIKQFQNARNRGFKFNLPDIIKVNKDILKKNKYGNIFQKYVVGDFIREAYKVVDGFTLQKIPDYDINKLVNIV